MRLFILFISLFIASQVSGQLFNDLKKIKDVYEAPDQQMEFNFTYKFYENLDKKVTLDSVSGSYLISNGNFVFKAGKYSLYKNEKYFIKIDPIVKSITVLPPSEKLNADIFSGLDTLFKAGGVEVQLLKTSNEKQRTYRLSQPYGNWADSVEITFNKSTYFIESMIVYLKFNPMEDNFIDEDIKKPVLVGKFNKHRVSKVSEENSLIFKESPYFNVSNGKLVLKEKYKGYSLLNRLN